MKNNFLKCVLTLCMFARILVLFGYGSEDQSTLREYLHCAKSHLLKLNLEEACLAVCQAKKLDPGNPEVVQLESEIQLARERLGVDFRKQSRVEMLQEVNKGWDKPNLYTYAPQPEVAVPECESSTLNKIRSIKIPKISFIDAPLSRIISILSEISYELDMKGDETAEKGVNIVLIDPKGLDPKISLNLRGLTLEQVLGLVAKVSSFQYFIENGVITFRFSQTNEVHLITEFFPITRGTVVRMTGLSEGADSGRETAAPTQMENELALKNFFERAGIPFNAEQGAPPSASFAFDGSQIIVTQTPKNLEKIKNILSRYKGTYQVEIEARFIEVQEGVLEELGFKWSAVSGTQDKRFFHTFRKGDGHKNNLREIADAFNEHRRLGNDGRIILDGTPPQTITIDNQAPIFPNAINLGLHTVDLASILGVLNKWEVNLLIEALEQHTGADLMSSPKVTVLSGKTARITVAQILRYPEAFGDIRSAVGTAGATPDSSSAGVTITAGTPQNFVEKNVGVEMRVTPFVEDDNRHISLRLEPKVTEFEGFVEYGGKSVAVTGRNTVTVPSGFFQPIFSTREISTEVTIGDGSTVVMGGLTREEVKMVHDKVPLLGDIPFIGRLFRSKGETNQKRNLIIFVTASLVSPNGTLAHQHLPLVSENGEFKSSEWVSPGGLAQRAPQER